LGGSDCLTISSCSSSTSIASTSAPAAARTLASDRPLNRHFRRRCRTFSGLRLLCLWCFGLVLFCGRSYRLWVKVCRLQRRGSALRLSTLCFLAALEALAHPFAHVWLVTHQCVREQMAYSHTVPWWRCARNPHLPPAPPRGRLGLLDDIRIYLAPTSSGAGTRGIVSWMPLPEMRHCGISAG
jgi:hypothetical protein